MKELLYKKSEAVAALNRVDGFHPMELARKIVKRRLMCSNLFTIVKERQIS